MLTVSIENRYSFGGPNIWDVWPSLAWPRPQLPLALPNHRKQCYPGASLAFPCEGSHFVAAWKILCRFIWDRLWRVLEGSNGFGELWNALGRLWMASVNSGRLWKVLKGV